MVTPKHAPRTSKTATVAQAEHLRLEAQAGYRRRQQLIGAVVASITALGNYDSAWAASLVKQAERVEAVAKGHPQE